MQSNIKDLDELAQMFKRIDKNKDGKLQIDELKAGLNEIAAFFQYEEIDYQ